MKTKNNLIKTVLSALGVVLMLPAGQALAITYLPGIFLTSTGNTCAVTQNSKTVTKALNTIPVTFTVNANAVTDTIGRYVWSTGFGTVVHPSSSGTDSYTTTYPVGTISSTPSVAVYGSGDIGSTHLNATIPCSLNLSDPPTIFNATVAPTTYDPTTKTNLTLTYTVDGNFSTAWTLKASLNRSFDNSSVIGLGSISLPTSYGVHNLILDQATYPDLTTLSDGSYYFKLTGTDGSNTVGFDGSKFTVSNAPATYKINPYASVVFANLAVKPDPFDSAKPSLTVSFDIDTQLQTVNLSYKIMDAAKSKTFFTGTDSITHLKANKSYLWDGKDSTGKMVDAGDYLLQAAIYQGTTTTLVKSLEKTFTITNSATAAEKAAADKAAADKIAADKAAAAAAAKAAADQAAADAAAKAAAAVKAGGGTDAAAAAAAAAAKAAADQAAADAAAKAAAGAGGGGGDGSATLLPSPDILTCKARAKNLYFEGDQPAYDMIGLDCVLRVAGVVNASVYNKSYDPKNADNSANLIKKIKVSESVLKGKFYVSWDGYDDFDQAVALGDYVFVVDAKLNNSYLPDVSMQKFTIVDAKAAATITGDTQNGVAGAVAGVAGTGAAAAGAAGGLADQALHGAAGVAGNIGDAAAAAGNAIQNAAGALFGGNNSPAAAAPKVASKCPGSFYPNDTVGSPYEDMIKLAYDLCLVKGYEDGTFKPNQNLTRAEAAKIIILASGHLAKPGCYNNSCGSPFVDLDMWQGPWVRAAWDLRVVSGIGVGHYVPNKNITRAEAVALITKGFGITPHAGCWSANCGAGFPDNLFNDIKLAWEGPYLRALWDAKVISTVDPGKFYPDISVTRGQFMDWAMKLVKIPAPAAVPAAQTPATTTTGGTSTPVGGTNNTAGTPAKTP